MLFSFFVQGMSNEEAARKFFEANPENAGINSAHRYVGSECIDFY